MNINFYAKTLIIHKFVIKIIIQYYKLLSNFFSKISESKSMLAGYKTKTIEFVYSILY